MSSIIQDLGIVEAVLGDVASFAAGNPVNASVDGYGVTVQVLPNGPTPPFTEITGSVFSILLAVVGLVGEFSAGAPINLAVKENKTWYGITLTPKVPLAPAPAA